MVCVKEGAALDDVPVWRDGRILKNHYTSHNWWGTRLFYFLIWSAMLQVLLGEFLQLIEIRFLFHYIPFAFIFWRMTHSPSCFCNSSVLLCQKGIKVTIVCPGPIETSNGSGSTTSGKKGTFERRVSSERCAELTIIAATHGLKEVWISDQPVLAVLYLVQYMPTVGYWLMDKIGGNRLAAAAQKGNTYSLSLLFGKKKAT